jgi:hypothetical protein
MITKEMTQGLITTTGMLNMSLVVFFALTLLYALAYRYIFLKSLMKSVAKAQGNTQKVESVVKRPKVVKQFKPVNFNVSSLPKYLPIER